MWGAVCDRLWCQGSTVGMEMPETGMRMRTGFPREAHQAPSFVVSLEEFAAPLGCISGMSYVESSFVKAVAAVPGARQGPELA